MKLADCNEKPFIIIKPMHHSDYSWDSRGGGGNTFVDSVTFICLCVSLYLSTHHSSTMSNRDSRG